MTSSKKTAKSAESKAAETIETTIDTVVKAGTEAVAKSYEKAVAASKEQVEAATKVGANAFKGYEDVLAYNQNNMEVLMKVSAIWFKGIQDINKEVTTLASTSMEQGVNASKQILGCKTVEAVIAAHSDLSRTNYDKVVAESRKLSDMSIKLVENTTAPIAVRVNETVATFAKPLAA